MIGMMIVRAAIRGAARNSGRPSGPPKEWSAGGKVLAGAITVTIAAGIITQEHLWVPVLCGLGSLAFVSGVIVACAMGSQRAGREREAKGIEDVMAGWEQPAVPSVRVKAARRKPGVLEKTLTLVLAVVLMFLLCVMIRAGHQHVNSEYGQYGSQQTQQQSPRQETVNMVYTP